MHGKGHGDMGTRRALPFGGAIVIVLALIAGMLVGCVPERIDGENVSPEEIVLDLGSDNSSDETLRNTTPGHISLSSWGNFTVDADVLLPDNLLVAEHVVRLRLFDDRVDEILPFFHMDRKDVVQEFDDEGGGKYYRFENATGDSLVVMPGSVVYRNADSAKYDNVFVWQPDTTLTEPYREEELGGMTSAEALSQADKVIELLGLSTYGTACVFSATKDALNESNQAFTESYMELHEDVPEEDVEAIRVQLMEDIVDYTFGEDDELYVIFYRDSFEEVPVTSAHIPYSGAGMETCLEGSTVRVVVGKTGIVKVEASDLYEKAEGFASDAGGSGELPITAEEALKCLREKYEDVLSSDSVAIDRIALEYCPVFDKSTPTDQKLVPAWTFRMRDLPDMAFRIDALTGQFLG